MRLRRYVMYVLVYGICIWYVMYARIHVDVMYVSYVCTVCMREFCVMYVYLCVYGMYVCTQVRYVCMRACVDVVYVCYVVYVGMRHACKVCSVCVYWCM